MTIATITREHLTARLEAHAPLVLFEALPEAHFAAGHLPGAFPLPLDRIAEIAPARAPDRDREVVVYCASLTCQNSHIAAAKLASLGYTAVRVFAGGKAEWREAGLPLEVTT